MQKALCNLTSKSYLNLSGSVDVKPLLRLLTNSFGQQLRLAAGLMSSRRWFNTKTVLVMKLTIVFLAAAILNVSAKGISQTVTFSGKNVPLEQVFTSVKVQTGYVFFFNDEALKDAKPVSVKASKMPLETFMETVLKDQPLRFSFQNKTIVISRTVTGVSNLTSSSVVVSSDQQPVSPLPIDIKGRVVNEEGEAVQGASVKVKGTNTGTTTNNEGDFSLTNVDEQAIIIITGANIENVEIKIKGKKDIGVVSAKIKMASLNEVVINKGYYTEKQRLSTGDVVVVKGEDLRSAPLSNVMSGLAGRVPGMIITESKGVAGAGIKLEIRGKSSIGLSPGTLPVNDPLIIVDGVPFAANNTAINTLATAAGSVSPLYTLDPNSIESIEILKDADATSIYGSRGANGVVLITTRKGRVGTTQFNLTASTGVGTPTRSVNWLNTQQYLAMRREAFKNDATTPTKSNAPDLIVWDTTRYTDFRKLILGDRASMSDVSGILSGGNNNTQFLLGGSFHREISIIANENYSNRITGMATINHQTTDKRFSVALNLNYSKAEALLPSSDVSSALRMPPNLPKLYDSTGNLNWSSGGVSFTNPLAGLYRTNTSKISSLISSVLLSYRIIGGLSAKLSAGYNTMSSDEKTLNPIRSQNPAFNPVANSNFGNNQFSSWILEPQLQYQTHFGPGKLDGLLGASMQSNDQRYSIIRASGFTSDAFIENASAAPEVTAQNGLTQYRYAAFFGRLNYNWADRYIVNVSGRRDGSSRFGPGRQFGNFGAVGAAWIFSNEAFFSHSVPGISYGKFRGSYGRTGSDQIGDYQFMDNWATAENTYNDGTVLIPARLANKDFQWQVNNKLEFALDLGFFKDKLLFTTAFYRNRCDNQLIAYTEPVQTGFSSIAAINFPGVVENKGWEFILQWKNINTEKFSWSSQFNISVPKNTLVAFPGLETSTYSRFLEVGKTINLLKVLNAAGVNPTTGVYQFRTAKGDLTSTPSLTDDRVALSRDPKFYGGWSNTFMWKGITLSFLIDFRKQIGVNYFPNIYQNAPGMMFNQPDIVLSRWKQAGDQTEIEKYTAIFGSPARAGGQFQASSNAAYSDASFIRLKTASLSYDISRKWIKAVGMKRAMVYVRAQNLFTITKYKGADPETQNYLTVPPLRVIQAGIQLSF